MLGKGLLKVDDYIRFGKIVDRLSEYCYMVMFVPKKSKIVATVHSKNLERLKEDFKDVKVVAVNGGLAFVELKW